MKCFQKQIDHNLCSPSYGEIRHIEVPCLPEIICIEDVFTIIVDEQDVNYGIISTYQNDLSINVLMDTISINHYCIDSITIFAIEEIKIFSNGEGGYYKKTTSITATGLSCQFNTAPL